MKKILLSLFILAIAGYGTKLKAQCNIIQTNVVVEVVGAPVIINANKCQFTINTQFDMTSNAGFKYLFFHSWLAADYPTTPIFDCTQSNAQDPGTSAQLGTAVDALGKSFLDYGFVNILPGTVGVPQVLTFATSFPHDNTVVLTQPSNSPGITATRTLMPDGTYHFSITNIKIIVNQNCGLALNAQTDIWGTNSNANDPKAQCYICGTPNVFNDPSITGFQNCGQPARQYSIGISTVDPVAKNITYEVWLDANGNSILETSGPDILAYTSPTISISSSSSYSSGLVSLPSPYSNSQPYSEYDYFILVQGPTLQNDVLRLLGSPDCIPLPVDFKSFTATRSNSSVILKWSTMFEQNSAGFAVERNTNGSWQQVAYVPTQALNGNSADQLNYQHIDANNSKSISQYRIKQIDLDGRSKYSEIRTVRGVGQMGLVIVFPNPSTDGKVNVSFENAATRDLSVADMSGRVIREIKGYSNNSITIENLSPGMYTLRVVDPATGEQVVSKIVVNKR